MTTLRLHDWQWKMIHKLHEASQKHYDASRDKEVASPEWVAELNKASALSEFAGILREEFNEEAELLAQLEAKRSQKESKELPQVFF